MIENLLGIRAIYPGDIPFMSVKGAADQKQLITGLYGARVEIPRRARWPIPVGTDIISRIGAGSLGVAGASGDPTTDGTPNPPNATPPPPTGAPPVPPTSSPPSSPAPVAATPVRRTFNFQLTVGAFIGDLADRCRVSPVIGGAFTIKELTITPLGTPAIGQYVDVRIATAPIANPISSNVGSSLFEQLADFTSVIAPDLQPRLALPLNVIRLEDVGGLYGGGQQIVVVSTFTAPAAAPGDVSVNIVIEQIADQLAPPSPRLPPAVPGPSPAPSPPAPAPPTSPAPTPVPNPLPPPPVYPARPVEVAFYPPQAPLQPLGPYGGYNSPSSYIATSGYITTVTAAEIAAGLATRAGVTYTLTLTPTGYQAVAVTPTAGAAAPAP